MDNPEHHVLIPTAAPHLAEDSTNTQTDENMGDEAYVSFLLEGELS